MSAPPPAARPAVARVPTGVPGLDTILRGGLLRGGLYLVEGQPGAGKTILGSQLCFAHVAAGGRAAYVTLLTETHARMLAHLRPLAFFDGAPLGDALVYLSGAGALGDAGLPGLLDLLRDTIQGRGATLLVVVGMVTAAETAARDDDLRRFMLGLQAHAEARGCTLVLLARAGAAVDGLLHTMVDGVLALRDESVAAETVRVAEMRKFRGGGYLRGRHAYALTDDGFALYPRTEAAYGVRGDPEAVFCPPPQHRMAIRSRWAISRARRPGPASGHGRGHGQPPGRQRQCPRSADGGAQRMARPAGRADQRPSRAERAGLAPMSVRA